MLVAAVGMTLVILARHIDISIGSQISVCAVAGGLLAQAGLPMPLAVLTTLLVGAILGASTARSSPGWACRPSWSRWPRWSSSAKALRW